MEADDAERMYRCYSASGFILRPLWVPKGILPGMRNESVDRNAHVQLVQRTTPPKHGRPPGRRRTHLLWDG